MLGIEAISQKDTEELLSSTTRFLVEDMGMPVKTLIDSRQIRKLLNATWNELIVLQGESFDVTGWGGKQSSQRWHLKRVSNSSISITCDQAHGSCWLDKHQLWRILMNLWDKGSIAPPDFGIYEWNQECVASLLLCLPSFMRRENKLVLHPIWNHNVGS